MISVVNIPTTSTIGEPSSTSRSRGGRIPESLQAVFVQAWTNEEKEIHEPPKDNSAFRVFERSKGSSRYTAPLKRAGRMLSFRWKSNETSSENKSERTRRAPPRTISRSRRVTRKDDDTASLGSESNHSRTIPSPSKYRHPRLQPTPPTLSDLSSDELVLKPKSDGSVKADELSSSSHSVASWTSSSANKTKSPEVFLNVMLRARGYETTSYSALDTGYYNKPTILQTSSFHTRLQDLVQTEDEEALRGVMSSGISPNPCNSHGESLLHFACRNGLATSVRVLLECGASVQVTDDTGRTVMHSAFFGSQPSFEIVKMILQKDRQLLCLKDHLGATPLSYIPRNQWGTWMDFFYKNRDELWPSKRFESDQEVVIDRAILEPNSLPLPNPPNALTPSLAAMLAAGRISVNEASFFMEFETMAQDDDNMSCSTSITSMTVSQHMSLSLDFVDEDDESSDEEDEDDDLDEDDDDDDDDEE